MAALRASDSPAGPNVIAATRVRSRSTICLVSSTPERAMASMNSSPPTRPQTSLGRSSAWIEAASVVSASSPEAWPQRSLISLKWSTSRATIETE